MKIKARYFAVILLWLLTHAFSLSDLYAINPQRKYAALPDVIGVAYQNHKIKVDESISLNSWICLQEDDKKPYIIISGSDAGNMANNLGQAQALYNAGYNVVLYDYRGFGESSDFDINADMLYYDEFGEDLRAVIAFVTKTYKTDKVFLYGLSMGTVISRMNVSNDSAIKGLILDSFVINPSLVKERIFKAKSRTLVLPEGAESYTESNKQPLQKPVLIFSGLQDMFTKTDDYKVFLEKNPSAKIVTWDCNHLECFTSMGTDSDLYVEEIKKFITKSI
ncbi:alpha/beta hydrolase [Olivibacter sp. XZL3]|uniref:alpha/beta hydrolase n=1 Tax=Olivibacter sp. XZL3 TaxID=1735116 RepID=UPI001416FF51|nr:alpha/beta hydrolase [Olivibacter sp. XZL3]